jgi:Kae1-associated kinase Bud32
MPKEKIIAQGAEALLIRKDDSLIKRRIKKSYRQKELDEKLRYGRTRRESKLLEKSSKIINAPEIKKTSKDEIKMQFIDGKRLSDDLDKFSINKSLSICKQLGEEIALLHNNNIIHGDLTTSNMILHKEKIYFIDFGLGFISGKIEDKAVDLHLLRQAFESKHFVRWQEYYKKSLEGYKSKSNNAGEILDRLKIVEERGRYKIKGKKRKK